MDWDSETAGPARVAAFFLRRLPFFPVLRFFFLRLSIRSILSRSYERVASPRLVHHIQSLLVRILKFSNVASRDRLCTRQSNSKLVPRSRLEFEI